MKLLRFFLYSLFALAIANIDSYSKGSKEVTPWKMPVVYDYNIPSKNKIVKKDYKVQANTWAVIDSAASYLTLGSYNLTPFFYEPITNTTLLFKRGAMGPDRDPDEFAPNNSKNNLFLRVSKDRGMTWQDQENIYINELNQYPQARYPNVFAFPNSNSPVSPLNIIFNASLIFEKDVSFAWKGIATGIYNPVDKVGLFVPLETTTKNEVGKLIAKVNGKDYRFGNYTFNAATGAENWNTGTAALLGYKLGEVTVNLLLGNICPTPAGDVNNNNNIMVLTTKDIDNVNAFIPSQFNSSVFVNPDSAQEASRSFSQAKMVNNNKEIYASVYGNFKKNNLGMNLAVSKSIDSGKTWTEFEVFPKAIIQDYIKNNWGANYDVNMYSFGGYAYFNPIVAFSNGDYSHFVNLYETDTNNLVSDRKLITDRKCQIVELYKENGNFGVRLVADSVPQVALAITEDNNGTLSGFLTSYELQASSTPDEQNIVVKWAQGLFTSIAENQDGTFNAPEKGSVILVSARAKNSNKWKKPLNITPYEDGSEVLNRNSFLVNTIPNDLKNIPILKLSSAGFEPTDLTNQRLHLIRQNIEISHFDADYVTDVEASKEPIMNIAINQIFPNPASKYMNLNCSIASNDNASFEITDAIGKVFLTFDKGFVTFGAFDVSLDIETLQSGNYFITLKSNNQRITKKFTVVR